MQRRPTVLVVDDAPSICRLTRRLLEDDCEVVVAHTAEEATEIARAVDVAIVDVHLCGSRDEDGVKLADWFAARGDVRVVLTTGDPMVAEDLELAGRRVLCKPFAIADLRRAVLNAPSS